MAMIGPLPPTEMVQPALRTPSPSRENNFNFMRLLFAVMVLLSHSFQLSGHDRHHSPLDRLLGAIPFGALAVQGFFLLSGFLITQSWRRTPDLPDFLQKRVLRIYPGFVVASVLSALLVGPSAVQATGYFAHFSVPSFLKGVLLLRPPVTPPVFAGSPYPILNSSMWTIEYEFRCYLLVAPLGVCGLLWRRRLWLALSIGVLLMPLAPGLVQRIHFPGARLLFGNPVSLVQFLGYFCVGGCFLLFRDRIRFGAGAALTAALLLALCLFNTWTAQIGLAVFGAYLLFWAAELQSPLLTRFRSLPDISYGVYLYGWPVQKLLLWYAPALSPWLVFVLACFLCAGLGLVSWYGVERPFLRLKPRPKAGTA